MENQIYVIYNKVSQRYGSTHVFANHETANRLLPNFIVEKFHTLADYELCHVGSIDIESGVIKAFPPVRIPWKSPALSVPVENQPQEVSK